MKISSTTRGQRPHKQFESAVGTTEKAPSTEAVDRALDVLDISLSLGAGALAGGAVAALTSLVGGGTALTAASGLVSAGLGFALAYEATQTPPPSYISNIRVEEAVHYRTEPLKPPCGC